MYPKSKETAERVLALILLVPAIVVSLAVALIIWFVDPGNPFFVQERVGQTKNGESTTFMIFKLRTMWKNWQTNPETKEIEMGAKLKNGDGRYIWLEVFGRKIPVGRVIRKWSLDELLQIVNVLRGEMSFVGPRPATPAEIESWREFPDATELVTARLSVKPGITGMAQVNGRGDLTLEQKLKYDNSYVDGLSFALDVTIWRQTIAVVLSGKGAY